MTSARRVYSVRYYARYHLCETRCVGDLRGGKGGRARAEACLRLLFNGYTHAVTLAVGCVREKAPARMRTSRVRGPFNGYTRAVTWVVGG